MPSLLAELKVEAVVVTHSRVQLELSGWLASRSQLLVGGFAVGGDMRFSGRWGQDAWSGVRPCPAEGSWLRVRCGARHLRVNCLSPR